MAATMGYELHPHHDEHFMPQGSDLTLCSGQRHVRVLTVPYFCGERTPCATNGTGSLHGHGEDQVVVWIPWDGEH